jgi:hypothetical protein
MEKDKDEVLKRQKTCNSIDMKALELKILELQSICHFPLYLA